MSRLRVAVIGGGRTPEHDVSLASAASVAAALDPSRYRVVRITIDRNGGWRDASGGATGISDVIEVLRDGDLVIPMVHGRNGEDGTLAALCELIGVPYIGSGAGAGAIGMNKHVTKLVAESLGIRTAPAALSDDARSLIESAAVRMYEALGCCGVARIDFFLTPEGLVLNEVNTTPGFTAQSQVPRMFEAAGVPYAELLDLLIADALVTRSGTSPQLNLRR